MNAGTSLGEIGDLVQAIDIIGSEGQKKRIEGVEKEKLFSYRKNHFLNRGDIIVGAELNSQNQSPDMKNVIQTYLKKRNDTQPLSKRTCGSVFKNISSPTGALLRAGELIDTAGLKGLRVGELQVSKLHANFIENFGQSESKENFVRLAESVREKVLKFHGVSLEYEVIFA